MQTKGNTAEQHKTKDINQEITEPSRCKKSWNATRHLDTGYASMNSATEDGAKGMKVYAPELLNSIVIRNDVEANQTLK